jgi:hypothetical protein
MTDKMMGARLSVSRQIDEASNDDRLVSAVDSPQVLPEPDQQGWDPFEVWRTRVKEARERTNCPVPADTGKG